MPWRFTVGVGDSALEDPSIWRIDLFQAQKKKPVIAKIEMKMNHLFLRQTEFGDRDLVRERSFISIGMIIDADFA